MKKIFGFILTAAALISVLPFALADGEGTTIQKGPDYETNATEEQEASIGYKKSISSPNTDGVYTITLESFALGQSIKLNRSIPADIVLVLDVSGSMDEYMGGRTRLAVMKDAVNAFIDKIDENDRIDPNTGKERVSRLGNRIAVVAFHGPRNSATTTPDETNSISVNTGLRTLGDDQDIDDYTGYDYLTSTVGNLSTGNGTFSNVGMRVAKNILSNLDDSRTLRTVVMFTDGDPGRGTYWVGRGANGNATTTVNGRTVLTNDYGIYTWRTANEAIKYANDIKEMATDKIISKVYTVSIISNPSSYTNVYLDQVSSNYEDAEEMAELLPYTTYWDTYYYINNWNTNADWTARTGTKVASKYAFSSTDADELKNVFETIAGESGGGSESLGEQTMSQVDVVSTSFKMPEGANKDSIKVFIAECTGKVTNKSYLDDEGNVQTGDFLTFGTPVQTWPEGNPNKEGHPVELSGFTYDKVTVTPSGTEQIERDVPVDRNIRVVLGASDATQPDRMDRIEVKGFDYGGNWCGPRYDEDGTTLLGYHGYKVMIQIPIMMNPTAVGGPDVATNAEGSGIHVNGENVAPFKSPKVSLPVNLHIRKEGLKVGESSKFTIEKKLVSEPETAWTSISSVFVTRREGQEESGINAPVTKVVGMPSVDEHDNPYIYRIVEDDWSWSYQLIKIQDAGGVTIGNVNTRSALSTELKTNPFVFINKPVTDIDQKVRHAESKATNIFKTGVTENPVFDDSKKNTRD